MKSLTKNVFGALLLACGALSAETIDLSRPDAWVQNQTIDWNDGTIKTKGRIQLASQKKFPVDPSKKYTFSFMVKASKPMNWMLAGFLAFDAKGRWIQSPNVNAVPGSMTVTAQASPRGARVIYIKDASKWKPDGGLSIVTGAKADYSDLPNFDIAATGLKAVEKEGDVWKVTLVKPLVKPLAENTSVRLHLPAGALYTCGITYVGDKWASMKGTISGVSKKPGYSYRTWPVGTVYGQAVILVNWKNVKDMTTELEELKLDIE